MTITRTELTVRFAKQQSFYRKAFVQHNDDGSVELYSYDTLVAIWKDDDLQFITEDERNLTLTTVKHLNEFISQMLNYRHWLKQADYRKLQELAEEDNLSLDNL